jgi:peptidoglycan/LPS O-acetylase OafA/YrhL
MPITINDPLLSTNIFIAIFVFILLISLKRKKNQALFPLALTNELKGLAILAVVFSHIGYFLSADHRFLFPLSIMAGVGVNLFLFLSGYGLTISTLKTEMTLGKFYKKRLLKLFTPFWIVIVSFFLLDFFLLHISYPGLYIVQALIGFFPRADLLLDIDSPLWFFTPVLFYYLIFPLVFVKNRPWLTAIIIYAASYLVMLLKLPVSIDVLHLYQLHILAFPLGIGFASFMFQPFFFSRIAPAGSGAFSYNNERPVWLNFCLKKFNALNVFVDSHKIFKRTAYYFISIALLLLIGYTAYYSDVDVSPAAEQTISLVTMGAIIFFFMLKKFEINALSITGLFAYEIYLIHWPLLSRYDFFFRYLPGWLAMVLYLCLFLIIARALKKISYWFSQLKISK